jgi:hypothetical protein
MGRPTRQFCVFLLSAAACCVAGGSAAAQDASEYELSVESNQVLVPVLPFAKPSKTQPNYDWQDPEGRSIVLGLAAKDFHLLVDGVEWPIDSVTFGPWPERVAHDNRACHIENFTERGVRWTGGEYPYSECPSPDRPGHFYQIAFTPPPSPIGSCHRISITVDRPNSVVDGRDTYCNTPSSSASDPLEGTRIGRWMGSLLASQSAGKLPVSLQAGFFYTSAQKARLHLALDIDPTALKVRLKRGILWAEYDVLGRVYRKDASVAAGFSERFNWGAGFAYYLQHRYEKQLELGPGEYDLRILFSDDVNYARVETHLTVDSYDGKELGISSILLGKQFEEQPIATREGEKKKEVLPGGFVPLLSHGVEVTPCGSTRFKRGELLAAYFEVYEPLAPESVQPKVTVHMRIVDAATGEIRDAFQAVDATPYRRAGSPALAVARQVPTKKLKKGGPAHRHTRSEFLYRIGGCFTGRVKQRPMRVKQAGAVPRGRDAALSRCTRGPARRIEPESRILPGGNHGKDAGNSSVARRRCVRIG